jgi:hypothetical protein
VIVLPVNVLTKIYIVHQPNGKKQQHEMIDWTTESSWEEQEEWNNTRTCMVDEMKDFEGCWCRSAKLTEMSRKLWDCEPHDDCSGQRRSWSFEILRQ